MFLILFAIEFTSLFFLSKFLTAYLSRLFFKLTKSQSATVSLLFYLFLPGIIVHELSHLLAAGLLFVRTGDMELRPQIIDREVRLGRVEIEKTDLVRRAIIGVAPVLVGTFIIFGVLLCLQSGYITGIVADIVSFVIILEVGNTLFSSKKDLDGTLEFAAALLILSTAILFLKPTLAQNLFVFLQKNEVIIFFKNADLFLIAPIVIDLMVIWITKPFIARNS